MRVTHPLMSAGQLGSERLMHTRHALSGGQPNVLVDPCRWLVITAHLLVILHMAAAYNLLAQVPSLAASVAQPPSRQGRYKEACSLGLRAGA